MVNTASQNQNQNQTRQTQSNPEKENGLGQSKSGQPITPMEMGKVKEVAEEHLMQVAVNATNIRDNKLHDIGEVKLSNATGKCSPRKLECRAGTSGRRECERQNEIKLRAVPIPQDISSQNISEVEESVNGPIKANSKPKIQKWKAKARAQTEKGSIMGRQTKAKRSSSTLSGQSEQN